MAKSIAMIVLNLMSPKAGAQRELQFNKLASKVGVLNIQV